MVVVLTAEAAIAVAQAIAAILGGFCWHGYLPSGSNCDVMGRVVCERWA